jgi:hypothetical protein
LDAEFLSGGDVTCVMISLMHEYIATGLPA